MRIKKIIFAFFAALLISLPALAQKEVWFGWSKTNDPKIEYRFGKWDYDKQTATLLEFKSSYAYKIGIDYSVEKDGKKYSYGTVIEANGVNGGLPGPSSVNSYKVINVKARKYN